MRRAAPSRSVEPTTLIKVAPDEVCYRGLERVGQKLARGIADFVTGVMGAPATVSVAKVSFEDRQAETELVSRQLVLEPASSTIEIALSRGTLIGLVDLYYGGEGREDQAREQLSPAEHRFLARITEAVSEHLCVAWRPFGAITPRVEEDAEFETGAIAVQTFSITLAEKPPFEIHCRYPLATLDAFPGLKSAGSSHEEQGFADHGWEARLMGRALDLPFPLRAVFAEPQVPVARLMHLRPGDIIPVCLPSMIELTVGGLPFARGSAGESNGRAAICIDHL